MHPNAQDWPVRLHLRIDWSEMDVFGHVNNVMFMKYVQAARVHYWETCTSTRVRGSMLSQPVTLFTASR